MSWVNKLKQHPYRFELFEALRRLECAHPDRPRLGRSSRASDDPVRLGQEPTLSFAPSTIASFGPVKGYPAPRLATYYLGLFGPNGPLPVHLTDYVAGRERHASDTTLRGFADVFHHRILSLFYRAWADSRPTVSFDRKESDRFASYVGSLLGVAMESLRGRDALPDLAKFHYVGAFACQSRHAEGLEAVLGDYFKLPVKIQQFVGQWLDVPQRSRWRLGSSPDTGALGLTTIVGARVWDCQQKFRAVFGPLKLQEYERLLPSSDSCARMAALVRTYVGDELNWEANLILERGEVPPLRLGGVSKLGWTTWLTTRKTAGNVDDLLLNPAAFLQETSGNVDDMSSATVHEENAHA